VSRLPGEISTAPEAAGTTLLVASRRRDRVQGGHLKVSGKALELLRQSVGRAVAHLEPMERREYWPDAALQVGEYYELKRTDVEDSLGVLALLDAGADTPLLSPEDLQAQLLLHAVLVGDDPTRQVAFVAKSNPARVLNKGIWLTPHGDSLRAIETPLFLFEDRVDMVVGPTTILVLNQLAFEQWFRESPAIGEHIVKWIDSITSLVPIGGDGPERLRAHAETNSRVRRLVRSISERDHLKDVPMSRIRRHIRAQGLDPDTMLDDGKLVLPDDPTLVLKLLNEDLFLGGLTDRPFISDHKAPRP